MSAPRRQREGELAVQEIAGVRTDPVSLEGASWSPSSRLPSNSTSYFESVSTDCCEECGFEYHLEKASDAGSSILEGSASLAKLIDDGSNDVLSRRHPNTWSPLEYGCHVRDVLLVQRERVLAARRTERPSSDPMGRDERVEHDGYAHQDPRDVTRQLIEAARLFANVLDRLAPEDWSRTLLYNFPVRLERSLRWVSVHTEHEVRHHLQDVQRQLH